MWGIACVSSMNSSIFVGCGTSSRNFTCGDVFFLRNTLFQGIMPPRKTPYGSKREPRGESSSSVSDSKRIADQDTAVNAGIQAKIDIAEDHLTNFARTLSQDCRPCGLMDHPLNTDAMESFLLRELLVVAAEQKYEHIVSFNKYGVHRNHVAMIESINSEISRILKSDNLRESLIQSRQRVALARHTVMKGVECATIASQFNDRPSMVDLSRTLSLESESLESLDSARNRLLRICELRRRQIGEISALAASLQDEGMQLA